MNIRRWLLPVLLITLVVFLGLDVILTISLIKYMNGTGGVTSSISSEIFIPIITIITCFCIGIFIIFILTLKKEINYKKNIVSHLVD